MQAVDLERLNATADRLRAHVAYQSEHARAAPSPASCGADGSDGWSPLDSLPEVNYEERPKPFPFDALGPGLGSAAAAIAARVQAPDALAGGSVLAAAAVAAQAHADVELPHGQRAPLSLFIATCGESGVRKSETDRHACAAIEERRRNDARRHTAELNRWKATKSEDDPPKAHSLTVSKGTPEGLHDLLRHQSHVGLFSTEGAELLAGHGMQKDRRAAGVAWLLKGWGADTLDDLTRGKGLSVLIARRLSMHLLIQPVILRELMGDPLAQGQGLIARGLIAAPQTLAGTRLFREWKPAGVDPLIAYTARLQALLDLRPRLNADGDGYELQPRVLPLSAGARALWIEAYDDVERRQADGCELAGVRPWASKFGEHAGRIAGIRALFGNPDATVIDDETMLGGLRVADFYLGEHLRLMGQSVERLHLSRLHTLWGWLKTKEPRVKHADVLQLVTREIRNLKAERINNLLGELVDRGYIRRDGEHWQVRP